MALIQWDEITQNMARRLTQEWAERFSAQLKFADAVRRGLWCVKCRGQYIDIGIAIVCNCAP
jgi:hypothetical protein